MVRPCTTPRYRGQTTNWLDKSISRLHGIGAPGTGPESGAAGLSHQNPPEVDKGPNDPQYDAPYTSQPEPVSRSLCGRLPLPFTSKNCLASTTMLPNAPTRAAALAI